jgi:SpoVK/Ycf46/Vps4 family AAA+-type ATPase
LNELADFSDGNTGSDMRDICQSAQLKVVSELFESGKADDRSVLPRPITMEDFRAIHRDRKPSVSADMMKAYQTWYDMFKAL